jgi:arylsulfatase A-like enzyme
MLNNGKFAFAMTGLLSATSVFATQKKPNIIFFIADDMRPYHFNCLKEGQENGVGKNLTPNIDRLAREGVILKNQYVASPVCTPSRYNSLTGIYASRADNPYFKQCTKRNDGQTWVEFNSHITPEDITLPKILQEGGYETGMVGKNHVVEVKGLKFFKEFGGYKANPKDPAVKARLVENHKKVQEAIKEIGFDYVGHVYHNNPDFLGIHQIAVQNMDWLTESGVEFIKKKKEKPFFMYFATTIPHAPEGEKRSWNADPHICATGYLSDEELPKVQPPRSSIPKRLKAAGKKVNKDTCNILWLDDALGAMIKALEESGEIDNTVIFFFNDHGQNAKGTLYEGGIHDPSIIWKKGGFKSGHELQELVSNIDFAPTILDIAGVDYKDMKLSGKPVKFDGVSFYKELYGLNKGMMNKIKSVLHIGNNKKERVLYHELGFARAIRKGNFKFLAVRYPKRFQNLTDEQRKKLLEDWNAERERREIPIVTKDWHDGFSHLTAIPGGGHAESESTGKYPGYYDGDQLYDLSKDPNEQVNLAKNPEYKAKLEEMKEEMKKVLDTLPGEFPL